MSAHEGVHERRARDQRQQRHERVHPRLLSVRREVGEPGRQPGADQSRHAVEQARSGPIGDRDRQQREYERKLMRGHLAMAPDRHPHVEHEVVEGRRSVLAEQRRDVRQMVRGDPDRQPLVDPVIHPDGAGAQPQRDPHEDDEDPQDVPASQLQADEAKSQPLVQRSGRLVGARTRGRQHREGIRGHGGRAGAGRRVGRCRMRHAPEPLVLAKHEQYCRIARRPAALRAGRACGVRHEHEDRRRRYLRRKVVLGVAE